jgi:hypothetical protein
MLSRLVLLLRRTGVRFRVSGVRLLVGALVLLLAPDTWHLTPGFAQQPQAQQNQPLSALNAKYVNGVAPGYWPTAAGGLTLNLSAGTALCGNPPAPVTYAGGTLTVTAAATNYVYLDPLLSCAPTLNTSGFGVGQIPIAVVVTNASTITGVNDVRTFFSPPTTMDSTGRSIFKGLNGAYFADQLGDKSTTGIASAISACGASTPCRVVVPGSYPTTETVPGSSSVAGTTSSNVQVQDYRYGDYQTAVNPPGGIASGAATIWHQWVDDVYNDSTHGGGRTPITFQPTMNNYNGGCVLSLPSPFYYCKSGARSISTVLNNYTPAEPNNEFVVNQYSIGDAIPVFSINTFYGGQAAQGDEGDIGVENYVTQGYVAYQGTIASGGSTGASSLTLSPTAGSGTQGAARYLINTSSGKTISSGTLNAFSNNGGGTPITATGLGTSWPISTVNTTATEAVAAPGVQTITVASTSGITTSTVLVVCDGSAYETVIPSAVGGGSCPGASCTITASFAKPHASGAVVASGGLSGYFLEVTADTVPSATTTGTDVRQAFPVLYSTSGTSLAFSVSVQGMWTPFLPGQATACIPPGCGYVLYPGAEVTSVYSAGTAGNTFSLMPNAVAWANGDTIELPQHPASHSSMGNWATNTWWPNANAQGLHEVFSGVPGQGTQGLWIQNLASPSLYSGGGGNLYAPQNAMVVEGPWASAIEMHGYGPSAYGMTFDNQTWGSGCPSACAGTIYPISVRPGSGNADTLSYGATSQAWRLSVGGDAGSYNFSSTSMSAPGHLGSSSADAAGSVTISSSTSATVNFGTSYNSAPKCVVTPTSDPTSVGAYWVTSTTSGFTVNVHTSGTMTFNYVCVGI